MEIQTPVHRDLFLAAITVIPAAIAWVFYEYSYGAILIAAACYLAFEFGIPAMKRMRFDREKVSGAIASLRNSIQSRVARGA